MLLGPYLMKKLSVGRERYYITVMIPDRMYRRLCFFRQLRVLRVFQLSLKIA